MHNVAELSRKVNTEARQAPKKQAKINPVPRIQCNQGDLAEATKAAFDILKNETDAMEAVYVRSQLLTRVVTYKKPASDVSTNGMADGSTILTPVTADWLSLHLGRSADWYGTRQNKDGEWIEFKKDVNERIARNIMADSPWEGLPLLEGVINAPIVTLDGRIIQTPGYDSGTGLLFQPNGTTFPTIPDAPTKEDAWEALQILKEPFKDFPFEDDVARSVALSAAITGVVRKAVDIAPMFINDAPTPSSGKTLLATIPALIATGIGPMILAPAENPESEKKALFSALLEGAMSIVIDNVSGDFGSNTLNSIITTTEYSDRVLGVSKNSKVKTNSLMLATGNNFVVVGDMGARTLICRIDPKVESPDSRRFDRHLPTWIPANRGALVKAVLTIVKAYLTAGCPDMGVENYGRFDQWQKLCRFPLIWLGCEDPCKSREKIKANNPEIRELSDLLATWVAAIGTNDMTIAEAIAFCSGAGASENMKALLEVMNVIAGDGKGQVSTRKLGKAIAKWENRIVDKHCFIKGSVSHRTQKWRVAEVGTP